MEKLGKVQKILNKKLDSKGAWKKVSLARMIERPTSLDYIGNIFDSFIEFHGDRYFGDDPSVVGGIALLDGEPVTVVAQQKGNNTKENIKRNFGMPKPEGYRKSLRLMKQADKFDRAIICFVDTPGAFCGMDAEERGQGEAIARNLMEMFNFKVPIISLIIGEGEVEVLSPLRWLIQYGCLKIPYILFYRRKDLQVYSGEMRLKLKRRLKS